MMYAQIDWATVGTRLGQARTAKALSQAEVARRLPISAWRVCKWENGQAEIPFVFISRLAIMLDVDAQWLLYGVTR